MNIRVFLALATLTSSCVFGSSSTFAAVEYDYTGNNVDMGVLSVGDTGTIGDIGHFGKSVISVISGTLPTNSVITFAYSFSGDIEYGYLNSNAEYSYDEGGSTFSGYAFDSNVTGAESSGFIDGSASTALAVASAQIDFSSNTATAIIQNFSSGTVNFIDLFVGLIEGSKKLDVSYTVSAVPVPAALPLFATGLAGLFGLGMRRKKKLMSQEIAA